MVLKLPAKKISQAIRESLDQLCDELIAIKKDYFTVRGKSGWSPLKESTIRVKKSKYPGNAERFNVQTGLLRDSIAVEYGFMGKGIVRIHAFVDNAEREWLTEYLTETLGRDYLDIDQNEQDFLNERLKRLLRQNLA